MAEAAFGLFDKFMIMILRKSAIETARDLDKFEVPNTGKWE